MKRALLFLALCAAACAQQDPAMRVLITGQFRIPADGDTLTLDVFGTDANKTPLGHKKWCASATPGGDTLPPQPSLSESIVLVQSGVSHPQVKINLALLQGPAVSGLGSVTASFESGRTIDVPITLSPP